MGGGGFVFGVMLCGTWDLSFPTKDPTCAPALKCDVLTTGPPGKSRGMFLDIGVKGENMIVLRVVLAMSTWDTSQGWTEEGK